MRIKGKTSPTPMDILTWKMNQSPEYAQKIIDDFDYAKREFANAGIEIDKDSHSQFKNAFEMLKNATSSLFKSPKKPKLTVIFVNGTPVMAET